MTDQNCMREKILFVDDDHNILDAFRRNFRKEYELETATSAREAAGIIARKGPFAVVVSDMRMPGVDGVQFLTRLKEICPDTIRIMLTGYADVQSSIAAVNEGSVFRFLTKPCSAQHMKRVLEDALRQYRLVTAEKQLLEQTLSGSIKVLTELLALVNPDAFGRANRIHRLVRQMALHLGMTNTWEIENAALLSQIGCMLLPTMAIQRITRGETLDEEMQHIYDMHPMIAADLLGHIPRLENVREMIAYQEKKYDGEGAPIGGKSGPDIPLGGRILKILVDFDQLGNSGKSTDQALGILRGREGWYDPRVLDVLERVLSRKSGYELKEVRVDQLQTGMLLTEDVQSLKGTLLVAQGQEVSTVLITRLRTYAEISGVHEPIKVLVPPVEERGEQEQDSC
ncbi:HD domain-containing phosphohydrolase [Desulfonatronum lacustre]|uniref:HD domain-containing phosphohydrolase n=1 Tax=Desulfonatronum lacustre TaxID=66849 RepID=UPI0004B196B0|nr:HD domain-containing phosphohydrolase [Desulfonatronum lacustre]SMP71164.1 Response regulator c-di-GMP phosphodiesterase, RpfG family, contains REC and HD-GYP domains [Desulfonatronum zhilinae]